MSCITCSRGESVFQSLRPLRLLPHRGQDPQGVQQTGQQGHRQTGEQSSCSVQLYMQNIIIIIKKKDRHLTKIKLKPKDFVFTQQITPVPPYIFSFSKSNLFAVNNVMLFECISTPQMIK